MRLAPLTALLLGLASLPALAQTSLEARVIVRWKSEAPVVRALALPARAGHTEVADLMQRRADLLAQRNGLALRSGRALDARTQVLFAQGLDSATLARRLARDPQVELAAVDRRRHHSRVPNDPIYANAGGQLPSAGQWYLKTPDATVVSSINAEAAWDRSTGHANVAIAVIDTGIRREHPDLADKLLPGYDMIGAGGGGDVRIAVANDGDLHDADPSDPGDWVEQSDRSTIGNDCGLGDSSWHGTHVAGLAAASSNNGVGIAGVSWGSRIVPIRALGKCGGYDSDILAAVRWAVGINPPGITVGNAHPVRVINMSLGSTGPCNDANGQLYREAFAEANARGAAVLVAAGNSAGEPVDSPANCAGAIAVTGLRHAGTKVGFSSMGPEVAIAAPGGNCVNIAADGTVTGPCLYPMVSTTNTGTKGPGSDSYSFGDAAVGTSFATPIAAGVAALLYSVDGQMTPARVRSLMQDSARPFPSTGGGAAGFPVVKACPAPVRGTEVLECYCTDETCGAGMLDAAAALARLGAALPPPGVSISASSTTPTVGNTVSLTSNVSPASGLAVASYAWRIVNGEGLASFSGSSSTANASLTASGTGRVSVQLSVTDSAGAVSRSAVELQVASAPPPPPPPPANNGGGGGGSSSPLWLTLLGLAALRARR
jgi:serine protease